MTVFYHSSDLFSGFADRQPSRLYIPTSSEMVTALDRVGSEYEPLPETFRRDVRSGRRYSERLGLVRRPDWEDKVYTHIETRVPRLYAARLHRDRNRFIRQEWDLAGDRLWMIADADGSSKHLVKGSRFYIACLFSDDPAARARGFSCLMDWPGFVNRMLQRIDEGKPIVAIDGEPVVASPAIWTPQDLALLLACKDREVRQRVRLLIGHAANKSRSVGEGPIHHVARR